MLKLEWSGRATSWPHFALDKKGDHDTKQGLGELMKTKVEVRRITPELYMLLRHWYEDGKSLVESAKRSITHEHIFWIESIGGIINLIDPHGSDRTSSLQSMWLGPPGDDDASGMTLRLFARRVGIIEALVQKEEAPVTIAIPDDDNDEPVFFGFGRAKDMPPDFRFVERLAALMRREIAVRRIVLVLTAVLCIGMALRLGWFEWSALGIFGWVFVVGELLASGDTRSADIAGG